MIGIQEASKKKTATDVAQLSDIATKQPADGQLQEKSDKKWKKYFLISVRFLDSFYLGQYNACIEFWGGFCICNVSFFESFRIKYPKVSGNLSKHV